MGAHAPIYSLKGGPCLFDNNLVAGHTNGRKTKTSLLSTRTVYSITHWLAPIYYINVYRLVGGRRLDPDISSDAGRPLDPRGERRGSAGRRDEREAQEGGGWGRAGGGGCGEEGVLWSTRIRGGAESGAWAEISPSQGA